MYYFKPNALKLEYVRNGHRHNSLDNFEWIQVPHTLTLNKKSASRTCCTCLPPNIFFETLTRFNLKSDCFMLILEIFNFRDRGPTSVRNRAENYLRAEPTTILLRWLFEIRNCVEVILFLERIKMKFVNCTIRLGLHLHVCVWRLRVYILRPQYVIYKTISDFGIRWKGHWTLPWWKHWPEPENKCTQKQRPHATAVRTFCINTIWSRERKKWPFFGTHSTYLNDFHGFSIFTSSTDAGEDGRWSHEQIAVEHVTYMQYVMHEDVGINFTIRSRTATDERTRAKAKTLSGANA